MHSLSFSDDNLFLSQHIYSVKSFRPFALGVCVPARICAFSLSASVFSLAALSEEFVESKQIDHENTINILLLKKKRSV